MISSLPNFFKNIKERVGKPVHLEFNLTDYCNLNCKGCSHYSPLATAEFEGLASLENSMKAISGIRNARKIREIYLIGGETLLYPSIKTAMRLAKKYFPWTRISIFTNGLMIPKMDEDFWEICRETGCVMAITRYPVKFDYDRVEAICLENGVQYEIFGDRSQEGTFFKFPLDTKKKQNGWLSHFRCFSFGCITVDQGRIFPCSQAACIGHLNRRFRTDFSWEKGDYIKVENLKDFRQLLRLRNRPIPFCRYCKKIETTKYGPSKRTVNEWI